MSYFHGPIVYYFIVVIKLFMSFKYSNLYLLNQ